jgi:hypothetical protein
MGVVGSCKVRKLFDKKREEIIFDPWLLGNLPWKPVFRPIFGGFEGFSRLECGLSWVQNEAEVKTKLILKSLSCLHLSFKRYKPSKGPKMHSNGLSPQAFSSEYFSTCTF